MNKKQIKAFTLVELIIVITILAILATIGFMSFQAYTIDARDTNRITSLREISKGIDIYQTKNGILPIPDNQTVTTKDASGNVITIQGYAGLDVQKIIKMTNNPKDPQNTEYYTYTINGSRTKYQLLALLEKNGLAYKDSKILNQTYAGITDYTTKYRYTLGNRVGIFFTGITNEPLQVNSSGSFDLSTKSEKIRVMFSNDSSNSGTIDATGSSLPNIVLIETKSVATNNPVTYSCSSTQPSCSPTGCTLIIGTPTNSNQSWVKDSTNCGFTCNTNYSGTNCQTYTPPSVGSIVAQSGSETALYAGVYTGGNGKTLWVAGTQSASTLSWKDDTTSTTNANNYINGKLNTGTFDIHHPASNYCQNLVRAGYSDWYLPAASNASATTTNCSSQTGELQFLYCLHKGTGTQNLLGFSSLRYWASNERDSSAAWALDFNGGSRSAGVKTSNYNARCVRAAD